VSELAPYKQEFIEFMVRVGVLAFGDFVLKSGRRSPYFVDTGRYRTGAQLDRLAGYYATALERELGDAFDVLFGPAYKGIPLAVSVATTLARRGHDVGFCFDRKEAKDHGEGGRLVGHPLADGDRVVIVEDVTTAGTSVRDTVPLLRAAADVRLAGLVVSVDRRERGTGDSTALAELADVYAMPAFAIVTIDEVIEHLRGREIDGRVVLDDAVHTRMIAYLREYGGRG
jgi:orotate phosphoribosyltransferase